MDQCKVCLKEIKHCSCAHHHVPHKKGEIPLPKSEEKVERLPEHHITNKEEKNDHHIDSDSPHVEDHKPVVKKKKGLGRK
jgi:hypothetical protein